MSSAPVHEMDTPAMETWPAWQRVVFRFFFVYLLLQIAPWNMFAPLPGVPALLGVIEAGISWAVQFGNRELFHVRDTLIPPNGSGDTSFAWAQLWLYLTVALATCAVWTIADRKRGAYVTLRYWLHLIVRYYIAAAALGYGVIKIFGLQMGFPTTSQLATPLGDLLPMRFSWLFIGYSPTYQIFSGIAETVAGLLLLFRPTITAGLFVATGAFLNVVLINLSYDVPVKLYSSHLLLACLFLLAADAPRVFNFLILNRATPATHAYDFVLSRPWQMWGARAVKLFVVYNMLVAPVVGGYQRVQAARQPAVPGPFRTGVYEVREFAVNGVAVPSSPGDSMRWKDVIFDSNGAGSVGTADAFFQRRYGRGYFRYKADTARRTASVWKTSAIPGDSTFLFTLRYEVPDTNVLRFSARIRADSVHVELVRRERHFPLAERQFHWLSEYNR